MDKSYFADSITAHFQTSFVIGRLGASLPGQAAPVGVVSPGLLSIQ